MIGSAVSVDSCSRLVCLLTTLLQYCKQRNEDCRLQMLYVVKYATKPPDCDGDVKTPRSAHSDTGAKIESM